jgi:putative membrane protein
MPEVITRFFQRWAVTTVAVLVADWLLDGIQHRTIGSLFAASALLGFLNAFVRPLLLMVSLPLLLWSLGLFVLVINALLLLLVGGVLQPGFTVDGFGSAFLGGMVVSLVSLIVNAFLGSGPAVKVSRGPARRGSRSSRTSNDGGGPIIDV